ncbi:exodeoxyribonuclease VII small subunit [bacterium]|nr:exodeoxyribonuclease VII small subunit [bacterium]
MSKTSKNLSFESAMEKLSGMIEKLEGGELKLDDMLKNFEEGMSLVKFCESKLEEAKGKLEKIVKKEDLLIAEDMELDAE